MFSAVMAENDGAVPQMLVLRHAADNGGGVIIFPVKGVNIPLNGVVLIFAAHLNECVIIVSVGRAEQYHVFAGELLHFFVWFHQFFFTLLC